MDPFVALWCSPLLRARETADIVGARIGLEPREDPRLMETDAGEWTDRLFSDVEAEDPNGFAGFIEGHPDFAFPGGESFAQQGVRVAAALADVEQGELPALVVCHGVVIRIALFQRARPQGRARRAVPNARRLSHSTRLEAENTPSWAEARRCRQLRNSNRSEVARSTIMAQCWCRCSSSSPASAQEYGIREMVARTGAGDRRRLGILFGLRIAGCRGRRRRTGCLSDDQATPRI